MEQDQILKAITTNNGNVLNDIYVVVLKNNDRLVGHFEKIGDLKKKDNFWKFYINEASANSKAKYETGYVELNGEDIRHLDRCNLSH